MNTHHARDRRTSFNRDSTMQDVSFSPGEKSATKPPAERHLEVMSERVA
jgi:hypothetical protein